MSEAAVIQKLRAACEKAGSQRAYADLHGIRYGYLRRVLCGERRPCDEILASLKLQRVISYRRTA